MLPRVALRSFLASLHPGLT